MAGGVLLLCGSKLYRVRLWFRIVGHPSGLSFLREHRLLRQLVIATTRRIPELLPLHHNFVVDALKVCLGGLRGQRQLKLLFDLGEYFILLIQQCWLALLADVLEWVIDNFLLLPKILSHFIKPLHLVFELLLLSKQGVIDLISLHVFIVEQLQLLLLVEYLS